MRFWHPFVAVGTRSTQHADTPQHNTGWFYYGPRWHMVWHSGLQADQDAEFVTVLAAKLCFAVEAVISRRQRGTSGYTVRNKLLRGKLVGKGECSDVISGPIGHLRAYSTGSYLAAFLLQHVIYNGTTFGQTVHAMP